MLLILLICLLFSSLVVWVVYFIAFRKPKNNSDTDFDFIQVKDDRVVGNNRKTNYLVFYNSINERDEVFKNIKLDNHTTLRKNKLVKKSMDSNSLSTGFLLILIFSFIILLAVNTGYWLFKLYDWIRSIGV